jgi:hypothetical protein
VGRLAVIGHRTICDLALRAVRERIGHDAWRTGPAALTLDTEPLERLLDPLLAAHRETIHAADAILVAVGRDDQIGFARALARRAGEDDRPVCLVVPYAPTGTTSLDVPHIPLRGLDRERLEALARGGRCGPGGAEAITIDAAPWSSAVRLWPARCLDEPAVGATGAVAAIPDAPGAFPGAIESDPPSGARRELAALVGVGCPGIEPVPLPAGAGERRLLPDDARQLVVLGTRLPDPLSPRPSPPASVPARRASGVVVRPRHDTERKGGVGVGRTAPEQIRGGLRRGRGRTLAVDLETGTVRPLSADALRTLEVVDGARSVSEILDVLGGAVDGEARERIHRALAELAAVGVIAM